MWLQIARCAVLGAALYNLINESELLTSRSTAYPRNSNHYKRDNDRCMKKRYGDERETKWKTEATNTSPEKNTKQKLDSIGIELRNSNVSEVFWGWALSHFMRLTTVSVNHCTILPYLRTNYIWKLVYKPPKCGIPGPSLPLVHGARKNRKDTRKLLRDSQ